MFEEDLNDFFITECSSNTFHLMDIENSIKDEEAFVGQIDLHKCGEEEIDTMRVKITVT